MRDNAKRTMLASFFCLMRSGPVLGYKTFIKTVVMRKLSAETFVS